MPKGGLLHIHLDATVDVTALLKMALEHAAIHIRSKTPLSEDVVARSLPEFIALPASAHHEPADIASHDYISDTWIPFNAARNGCSLGKDTFDKWVISALTINPSEAYRTHNTVTKVGLLWKVIIFAFPPPLDLAKIYQHISSMPCKLPELNISRNLVLIEILGNYLFCTDMGRISL